MVLHVPMIANRCDPRGSAVAAAAR
jgi:hypothetical protein